MQCCRDWAKRIELELIVPSVITSKIRQMWRSLQHVYVACETDSGKRSFKTLRRLQASTSTPEQAHTSSQRSAVEMIHPRPDLHHWCGCLQMGWLSKCQLYSSPAWANNPQGTLPYGHRAVGSRPPHFVPCTKAGIFQFTARVTRSTLFPTHSRQGESGFICSQAFPIHEWAR